MCELLRWRLYATQSEAFVYDELGNRVTYWDHHNSITTAYGNNKANEYTTVTDVVGAKSRTLGYFDSGSLRSDEGAFETGRYFKYGYDHSNRLTEIGYYDADGAGFGDLAHFEYDALGRMISSQVRYDTESASANTETLLYFYDGNEVIAEYDESLDLQRRYVHGANRVDERAVMLSGDPEDLSGAGNYLDTYYYLLQELGTPCGLMLKNSMLVEAYTYDAYGQVHIWDGQPFNGDRDGDVQAGPTGVDYNAVMAAFQGSPTPRPTSTPTVELTAAPTSPTC